MLADERLHPLDRRAGEGRVRLAGHEAVIGARIELQFDLAAGFLPAVDQAVASFRAGPTRRRRRRRPGPAAARPSRRGRGSPAGCLRSSSPRCPRTRGGSPSARHCRPAWRGDSATAGRARPSPKSRTRRGRRSAAPRAAAARHSAGRRGASPRAAPDDRRSMCRCCRPSPGGCRRCRARAFSQRVARLMSASEAG